MKKTQFEIEFLFRASPTMVYSFITSPTYLIRWFCDEADVESDVYTFRWKDSEETAVLVDDFEDELLRFRWEDAVSDNEFLEFHIETSPVTEETILRIIGWAEPSDHQFQIDFLDYAIEVAQKSYGRELIPLLLKVSFFTQLTPKYMAEGQPGFKQSLKLTDATMLVAGSMIGSGIFIVSADTGRMLGSSGWMMAAWLFAGILTLIAALSYGELAAMFPKAGGQYVYLREAYNPLIGFLYGWTMFTVIQAGTIAAVAVAFAKFTSYFVPWFGEDNILFGIGSWHFKGSQVLAILSILVLSGINLRGINVGKVVQTSFTLAKIIALFGLILLGLTLGYNADVFSANLKDMWHAGRWDGTGFVQVTGSALLIAFGGAMVGTLFSSDSWNNVTFIAGEIKDPKRNIPRSLFLGTLIVTILYLLTNLTYLALLPLQGSPDGVDAVSRGITFAVNDRVGTAAASLIFGASAAAIMSILIMISTFGCNNGLILSGSRLYYAMAEDKLFFPKAGVLNDKAVPGFGIKAQAIWASALCLTGTYSDLLDYCIFAALLFYILTIAGIFILRRKRPEIVRPYKAFGFPILPAFYIIAGLVIAVILLIDKTENTLPGLVIVLLGIPVYFLLRKKLSN